MPSVQRSAHLDPQAPVDPWSLRAYTCKPKPHRYTDDRWKAIRSARERKRATLGVEDFQIIRRIGRGDVGSVHLVRLKGTNVLYAMKVLEKAEMVERNKLHRVRTEDTILSAVDHPFVATLFTSFQTGTSLHFVMEVRSAAHRRRASALNCAHPPSSAPAASCSSCCTSSQISASQRRTRASTPPRSCLRCSTCTCWGSFTAT